MPDSFGRNSRFRNDPMITVPDPDGSGTVETIGRWKLPSWMVIPPDPSLVKQLVVRSGLECRPDLIANEIYDSPDLDWVLLVFNNVTDTLNWPKAGDIISYPAESVVIRAL